MVKKEAFCMFNPPKLTEIEAMQRLGLKINNYPTEEFKFIQMEDIIHEKYFITSFGRIFTSYGRELFPEEYYPPKKNNVYLRIELSCSGYIKRRKFFVHRLVGNAFIPKTQDDINNNRDLINHKYNKDGRCNFSWNLEWVNDSENTLHGLYFNEPYDEYMFNFEIIMNRRNFINYDQYGDNNPNSRISEYQAHLICYGYTVYGYSPRECAIYAWMEGNDKDVILVNSIINGYSWTKVSSQYGIVAKPKIPKSKRANPKREDKKEEYDNMKKDMRR